MSKKKKHKNELVKAMDLIIDLGIFDKMVEDGAIKFFQSEEEINDFMKSNDVKEDTVTTIDGYEGRRLTKKIGRNQRMKVEEHMLQLKMVSYLTVWV